MLAPHPPPQAPATGSLLRWRVPWQAIVKEPPVHHMGMAGGSLHVVGAGGRLCVGSLSEALAAWGRGERPAAVLYCGREPERAASSFVDETVRVRALALDPAKPSKRGEARGYWQRTLVPAALAAYRGASEPGGACWLCCDSGTNVSVTLALAVLTAFFDDRLERVSPEANVGLEGSRLKEEVRRRFVALQQCHPYANPPRRFMKEVLAFFEAGSLATFLRQEEWRHGEKRCR
jgi:hypothetical protein